MSLPRGRLLALATTLLLAGLATGAVSWRLDHWRRAGWAGMTYPLHEPGHPLSDTLGVVLPPGSVLAVHPGGPAFEAGVRTGDLVLSVNGIPLESTAELVALDRRARRGDRLLYRVEAMAGRRQVEVELRSPFASTDVLIGVVTNAALAAAFLGVGLFVCWRHPEGGAGWVFFLLVAAGAGLYLLFAVAGVDLRNQRGVAPVGGVLEGWWALPPLVLLSLLMGNLFLHLSLVFPRRRELERWPRALVWLHTLPFWPLAAIAAALASAWGSLRWPGALPAALAAAALALAAHLLWGVRRRPWRIALLGRPLRLQSLGLMVAGLAAALVAGRVGETGLTLLVLAVLAGLALFWLAVVIVYSTLTGVVFYRSYRAGGEATRRLRWPLRGTVAALVAATAISVVSLVAAQLFPVAMSEGPWLQLTFTEVHKLVYLLIPVSFAVGLTAAPADGRAARTAPPSPAPHPSPPTSAKR